MRLNQTNKAIVGVVLGATLLATGYFVYKVLGVPDKWQGDIVVGPPVDPNASASGPANAAVEPDVAESLAIAELMIDAFYSFEREELAPFLVGAGESAAEILYYQGWAEGGNYRIVRRAPCAEETEARFSCSITVEDDLVLALSASFKATDTFTISFDGKVITNVETSSDDQPVYYQALDWVEENMPDVMEGPCRGFFANGPTPGDCARAMAEGYRRFATSDAFPD